jgi:chemotaxis family two-component system response regulator Rcp1
VLRGESRPILIVEDNPGDVFLIRRAIEAANVHADLRVVHDGEQAIRFFDEVDADAGMPCPALVILDINLPRKHGGEVLQHMRQSHKCCNAIVLVVSTSDSPRDREEMKKLGANDYFRKPSEYADFMKLGAVIQTLLNSSQRA